MKIHTKTLTVLSTLLLASAVHANPLTVFSKTFVNEQMNEAERRQFGDCTTLATSEDAAKLERSTRSYLLLRYGNKAMRDGRLQEAKDTYIRAAGCGSAEGARNAFATSLQLQGAISLEDAPVPSRSELWNLVWSVTCLDRTTKAEELARMTGNSTSSTREHIQRNRERFCADGASPRWSD